MTLPPLENLKVVTAQEMARIENLAYADGTSEETFMENAGAAVAQAALAFLKEHHLPKIVTLLAGKGNNAGDAFAAGVQFLQHGVKTVAFHIYALDECSPLCREMHDRFLAKGGSVHRLQNSEELRFGSEGVILDGLVGTGFRGKAEGILATAIESANRSKLPILAIDIPSGVNGTTGEVGSIAIQARETLFLGLPKIGFFLKDGWNYVGKLKHATFGLAEKYTAVAKASAYLFNEDKASEFLPPIKRTRHKYQAGYVLAIAGSRGFPGAALLSSYAVLRAGAGIVRLMHPYGMDAELSGAPFEIIREGWDAKNLRRIKEEAARAKVILIGPGMGRTKDAKKRFQQILKTQLPLVLDADALYFLSQKSSWKLPPGSVLTPHRGEMNLLLSSFPMKNKQDQTDLEICQAFAQDNQVTLVLKGAPTYLFHPGTMPLIIPHGDPGMATAGSGDVLTGIIAALIAQGLDARAAAALSIYLHARSGELAATALTSYGLTASDLIDYLPQVFKHLVSCGHDESKKLTTRQ